MHKLSFIVPYHNEDESLLIPLLSMLNVQTDIDWEDIEVIISNNCEQPKKLDNFFRNYPKVYPSIKYVECPNKSGMGQNRQYGLDIADGEYVMFSDCDDSLMSPLSLSIVMEIISSKENMYLSPFYSERKRSVFEVDCYLEEFVSSYLLHGKVFKRSFLVDNGIHFCPHIFAAEDLFFMSVCSHLSQFSKFNDMIYLWRFREDSVSNEIGNYLNKYLFDGMLYPYYVMEFLSNHSSISGEKLLNAFSVCMVYMYGERVRLSETTAIGDEITAYIYQRFEFIHKGRIDEIFKNLNAADFLIEWLNSIKDIDTSGVREKYNIQEMTRYEYKPTEINYIK